MYLDVDKRRYSFIKIIGKWLWIFKALRCVVFEWSFSFDVWWTLYTERKNWQLLYDKTFYHTNYGVVQGFPALRKAVTTLVKKIRYFFTCVWYRQSAAERHTPFTPLGQVDEWTAKPSPFSIQGRLSEYFRIMSAKKPKYSYRRLQRVTFKLS